MVRNNAALFSVLLALSPVACSSSDGALGGTDALVDAPLTTQSDVVADGVTVSDWDASGLGDGASSPGDATPEGTVDGQPLDTGTTTSPDGAVSEDVGGEPCEGCFGAPCASNDDCHSGWCTDGPDGPICTKTCSADCPALYSCKSIAGVGGDPVYICIYDHLQACRPCDGAGDCVHPVSGEAAVCVDGVEDVEGAFCATPCSVGGECPAGMACDPVGDATACMPASGVCLCSVGAIAAEATTSCQQSNAEGVCDGVRMCTQDGLTPCDAPVPVAEACNVADDDCDGSVDEGFEEVGTPCDGADDDLCNDGAWVCTVDGLHCDD
ncbi:MAG: hypothetical protein QF464_22350, partial [Myxococcota bacterium]|nr:hypothetical protein [Myxococcota bacterium]